jgi:hypothetical protein
VYLDNGCCVHFLTGFLRAIGKLPGVGASSEAADGGSLEDGVVPAGISMVMGVGSGGGGGGGGEERRW